MADGGIITDAIGQAAHIAAAGLDPIQFLHTRDSDERNLMVYITNKVIEIENIRSENLAKMIASEVSKLFKK